MKAGAFLGDANKKKKYSEKDLAKMLYEPASPGISYILAANEKLYNEALSLLKRREPEVTGSARLRLVKI